MCLCLINMSMFMSQKECNSVDVKSLQRSDGPQIICFFICFLNYTEVNQKYNNNKKKLTNDLAWHSQAPYFLCELI